MLTVKRKVATGELEENSPQQSFSKACTRGLLLVRLQADVFYWIMYRLKCLVAAVMDKVSISHGSQMG